MPTQAISRTKKPRMSNKRGRSAFTLIEVLLSVALTGLIAALAFAPVVYVVRQITETETAYTDEAALRRTAMFMSQDLAASLRMTPVTVRVVAHQELGGWSDATLIVASTAQAKQNLPAGSVVYRVVRWSFMNDKYIPGLYRWLLPGILPEDAEYEKLDVKDGQLITPYVTELKLSVWEPPEWVSDYGGKLPEGVKFVLSREEESVEYVFGLPR